MKSYQKGVYILLVVLSTFMLQGCGNKDIKYIEKCIELGEYQNINIIVDEYDLDKTGKTGDLIADINNYNKVIGLLGGQRAENDLEKAKRQIKGFNGSYKKYSSFEDDVKELEERIEELESNREEIGEIIEKTQDSYEKKDYILMEELLAEYENNEVLISDTSREQREQIERLQLKYSQYQSDLQMKKDEEKRKQQAQDEWNMFWEKQEELQKQIENNPPKDSIDTEIDIVD